MGACFAKQLNNTVLKPKHPYKVFRCICEKGMFFVGSTTLDLDMCLHQLQEGGIPMEGSAWVTEYKPLNIILHSEHPTKREARIQETAYTLELMNEHGVENVRGGRYNTHYLTNFERQCLVREMAFNDSLCVVCLKPDHSAKECSVLLSL
jgi:hypothetical protein